VNGKISGSIFWFSVPVILPENFQEERTAPTKKARVVDKGSAVEVKKVISNLEYLTTDDHNLASEHDLMEGNMVTTGIDYLLVSEMSKKQANISSLSAATPHSFIVEPRIIDVERAVDADSQQSAGAKRKSIASGVLHESSCSSERFTKRRKKFALIIDDSKTIRKVLKRALKNFGFEVVLAENGMQGFEEMKSTVFDVVLCDFLMPIMDGMDCVKQYREWECSNRSWFEQYIVGISAHADDEDGIRGLKVGMNKFIPKPLPIKMLKRLVDSEEVNEISKKLDLMSSDNVYLPYFVDSNSKLDFDVRSASSDMSEELVVVDPTCLLVEDSISVSKAMMRYMERKGWKCSLARDGEEGLRLLKTRNWDAVFMDDQLPLVTGMRCVMKFREWETINRVARQKNVYLCSANSEQDSSPTSGFDGVFAKPFKAAMLDKILDECAENVKRASLV